MEIWLEVCCRVPGMISATPGTPWPLRETFTPDTYTTPSTLPVLPAPTVVPYRTQLVLPAQISVPTRDTNSVTTTCSDAVPPPPTDIQSVLPVTTVVSTRDTASVTSTISVPTHGTAKVASNYSSGHP